MRVGGYSLWSLGWVWVFLWLDFRSAHPRLRCRQRSAAATVLLVWAQGLRFFSDFPPHPVLPQALLPVPPGGLPPQRETFTALCEVLALDGSSSILPTPPASVPGRPICGAFSEFLLLLPVAAVCRRESWVGECPAPLLLVADLCVVSEQDPDLCKFSNLSSRDRWLLLLLPLGV